MQTETNLGKLLNLSTEQAELLKVAGFLRPIDLARQTPDRLVKELVNAKKFLELDGEIPSTETAGNWLDLCGVAVEEDSYQKQAPDLRGGLRASEEIPEAVYLDKNQLRLLKVGPAKFPRAVAQQDIQGPLRAKRKLSDPGEKREPKIDAKRVKRMEDYAKDGGSVAPLERGGQSVRTTPKQETNKGKKQTSRSYIRGVLHPSGPRVWFAALNTLFFYTTFPLAMISVVTLFALPEEYEALRWYLFIAPLLALISGIVFMSITYRTKCCVCSQRLFVPKNCNKNKKAHRIWGLGFVLPIAIHTVLFRWFRCTFCGTTVRTKE